MTKIGTLAALDVWAAARHHAANGAQGHPPYSEIFAEPQGATTREAEATSSAMTYDATSGKYDKVHGPSIDHRILAAIESVERALRKNGAPEWFRSYLLFKHPRLGRFAPKRVNAEHSDPDDDARAFVEGGHMSGVHGGILSGRLAKLLVRTVRATEREFTVRLATELANRPAHGRRAPSARSDSRARRGTA